jgi:hypothetical protein
MILGYYRFLAFSEAEFQTKEEFSSLLPVFTVTSTALLEIFISSNQCCGTVTILYGSGSGSYFLKSFGSGSGSDF